MQAETLPAARSLVDNTLTPFTPMRKGHIWLRAYSIKRFTQNRARMALGPRKSRPSLVRIFARLLMGLRS